MRLILPVFSIIYILLSASAYAQPADIEDFFEPFTADWVRANPNQAISTRFFYRGGAGVTVTAADPSDARIPG